MLQERKSWPILDLKEEEEDKPDGPNGLFQQLYAGGDDGQRRAMVKSYTESGGTTLSMDWKDIGSSTKHYKH